MTPHEPYGCFKSTDPIPLWGDPWPGDPEWPAFVEKHKQGRARLRALEQWKLRVGWLGQFLDHVTRGWWARAILKDPRP